MYEYLGLRHVSGLEAISVIITLSVLCTVYVLWHARRRLRLSRAALRDTEWPNR